MCVVSMVSDHYDNQFKPYRKYIPPTTSTTGYGNLPFDISRQEFEDLKKEVLHMKELLKAAKLYDEKNNEPDCEIEEKITRLREIAKLVGIDLDDVISKKK